MYGLDDFLHDTRVCQRTRITQLILLTSQNLSQNSPHDLA